MCVVSPVKCLVGELINIVYWTVTLARLRHFIFSSYSRGRTLPTCRHSTLSSDLHHYLYFFERLRFPQVLLFVLSCNSQTLIAFTFFSLHPFHPNVPSKPPSPHNSLLLLQTPLSFPTHRKHFFRHFQASSVLSAFVSIQHYFI